ncbi:MAG: gamma carbonic anhydrase family protein, partial [Akkermansiaceae bacterium]
DDGDDGVNFLHGKVARMSEGDEYRETEARSENQVSVTEYATDLRGLQLVKILSLEMFFAMASVTFEGMAPDIHESAFVASSADVIGQVQIEDEASVWYNTTLRGDINKIVIGPKSNIQDNACIHLADDYGAYIGELVTVGHSAIIHACTVKDEVLVGMGACILDGAVIGERSIIGAHALVTGGTEIPPGSLVLGSPAKVVKTLDKEQQEGIKKWAEKYVIVSRKFLARPNGGKV